MGNRVLLSQCMIVKNEEKNIEKALSWGKDIVCEQIVVDTGSEDRTVEIAERMGAKVFHFKWIDDFAAAKNYAIEQARGNWIAFLDADEYFQEKDAQKLWNLLNNIDSPNSTIKADIINCAWLHLNEQGEVFSTSRQTRIFRKKDIRYQGKIHEQVHNIKGNELVALNATENLSIFHTGYTRQVYRETNKLDRNRALIQKILDDDPENYNYWGYLGDTLHAAGRNEEAEAAYYKVIDHLEEGVWQSRADMAFATLIKIMLLRKEPKDGEKVEEIYSRYQQYGKGCPDVDYWAGMWMMCHGDHRKGITFFENGLKNLETYKADTSLTISSALEEVYQMLAFAYGELNNKENSMHNCVLALRINRYNSSVLDQTLILFRQERQTENLAESVLAFLGRLYDLSSLKDKLYLLKAARKAEYEPLAELLYNHLSETEREWLDKDEATSYFPDEEAQRQYYPRIICNNQIDLHFMGMMEEIRRLSIKELEARMKDNLRQLVSDEKQKLNYNSILDYYKQYTYWGSLKPEIGDYGVFSNCSDMLGYFREDLIWLYSSFMDYRSKKTLTAILNNWMHLNCELLVQIRESQYPFFDLDIIPGNKGAVFVDVGAYDGDSMLNFIRTYGKDYERIHCYEITREMAEAIERKAVRFPHVSVHNKAAWSKADTLYLQRKKEKFANCIGGFGGEQIEAVTLDEDVEEKISFLKINTEGTEGEVLKGSIRHIQEEHPIIAVCIAHGFEELCRIPRMIQKMDPTYRFYLRYYGGSLVPTEYVLYAV